MKSGSARLGAPAGQVNGHALPQRSAPATARPLVCQQNVLQIEPGAPDFVGRIGEFCEDALSMGDPRMADVRYRRLPVIQG